MLCPAPALSFVLTVLLLAPPLTAHAQNEDATRSVTITIPDARIADDERESTESDPELAGEIAQTIQDAVPPTGSEGLDDAVDTLAVSVGNLMEAFIERLPRLSLALVVLILTAIGASVAQRMSKRVFARMRLRRSLQDLFGQLIFVGNWFVGTLIACSIVFPGFGATELVATAGLLSIAIGFAFQDIFENFFAGILILWRFPFEIGDFIEIEAENIVGRVEDIWIRMTLIRLNTGELVTVPNATVYKSPIRVLTDRDHRRQTLSCGIAYGEDVGEARSVITKAVRACASVSAGHDVTCFSQDSVRRRWTSRFSGGAVQSRCSRWPAGTKLSKR